MSYTSWCIGLSGSGKQRHKFDLLQLDHILFLFLSITCSFLSFPLTSLLPSLSLSLSTFLSLSCSLSLSLTHTAHTLNTLLTLLLLLLLLFYSLLTLMTYSTHYWHYTIVALQKNVLFNDALQILFTVIWHQRYGKGPFR